MARITGNKGEWGELYVLLYLLSHGKLNTADADLNIYEDVFLPVLKVLREEVQGEKIEYVLPEENAVQEIQVFFNDEYVASISKEELKCKQKDLYWSIVNESKKERAFEIESMYDIMKKLHCKKLKAPSDDKTDIVLQVHDINTGYAPVCGFSIKSAWGSPATLLNASKQTNFVYEVVGLDEETKSQVNAIFTKNKIIDRIKAIYDNSGLLEYRRMKSDVFRDNLMMIDSMMPEIIGHILLYSYATGVTSCEKIVEVLEWKNPFGYTKEGMYRYKFKKLLCASALGMMPGKAWNGYDEANGGYIIVKNSGEVVAYQLYNRNSFEDYLLHNTKLDRGSISKHDFATIYEKDGKMYINLNIQIRFK